MQGQSGGIPKFLKQTCILPGNESRTKHEYDFNSGTRGGRLEVHFRNVPGCWGFGTGAKASGAKLVAGAGAEPAED
jgi:hypothetical protein